MPTSTKQAQPRQKPVYRVRNWAAYDRALVQRGDVTVWVNTEALAAWYYQGPPQRGAQPVFSDLAIETALTLKEVFHLTNRMTEGKLQSVLKLMGLDLKAPDHTTLSRRGQTVPIRLPKQARGPLALVVDSSGLKVYGEGEWKVRQHGVSKRRTWRKVHLGVDPASGEIQAAMFSGAEMSDGELVATLLAQVDQPLSSFAGDGAYDQRQVYAAVQAHSPDARPLIPPRRGAHIWQRATPTAPPLPRDENLRALRAQGRAAWKKTSGYHQRSLAETAVFRFKRLFGSHLSAVQRPQQATQVAARCRAMNLMTQLGMPVSVHLAAA
jgi:hypothetical protein